MKKFHSTQVAYSVPFDNDTNGYNSDNVQGAIEEGVGNALNTPIYTIVLQHNGTVSNGTFIGYDSLIPGDATPVLIPRESEFTGFTFSNASADADYTLEFRINTTVGTPFYSVSKINVQYFNDILSTPVSFSAGDQIYIKYIDDGTNASDVVIMLTFRASLV